MPTVSTLLLAIGVASADDVTISFGDFDADARVAEPGFEGAGNCFRLEWPASATSVCAYMYDARFVEFLLMRRDGGGWAAEEMLSNVDVSLQDIDVLSCKGISWELTADTDYCVAVGSSGSGWDGLETRDVQTPEGVEFLGSCSGQPTGGEGWACDPDDSFAYQILLMGTWGDEDGDGVAAPSDCDDGDADVQKPTTWYFDSDGDGVPGEESENACDPPGSDWYAEGVDCDDADPDVSELTEACRDLDGDGVGNSEDRSELCGSESGWVARCGDCDDESIFVGEAEGGECPAAEPAGGCCGTGLGAFLLVPLALRLRRRSR